MPKSPPFFVVDAALEVGKTVELDERARRHARARRLATGDGVRLVDGRGNAANGTVEEMDRGAIRIRIDAVADAVSGATIELFVPAIRRPRLAWLVEKATELGAGAVTIVASERAQRGRVEAAAADRSRLERVARESAAQSGQARSPRISGPIAATDVVGRAAEFSRSFVLDRSGSSFPASLAAPAGIWIGPEGGWSAAELSTAESAGWTRVRLPGATLRAETAAIAALVLALRAIDTAARPGGQ